MDEDAVSSDVAVTVERYLGLVDARWHPLIDEALAYWRGEPADPRYRDVRIRATATAELVLDVARAAAAL